MRKKVINGWFIGYIEYLNTNLKSFIFSIFLKEIYIIVIFYFFIFELRNSKLSLICFYLFYQFQPGCSQKV